MPAGLAPDMKFATITLSSPPSNTYNHNIRAQNTSTMQHKPDAIIYPADQFENNAIYFRRSMGDSSRFFLFTLVLLRIYWDDTTLGIVLRLSAARSHY
jgi:hypothetical protein